MRISYVRVFCFTVQLLTADIYCQGFLCPALRHTVHPSRPLETRDSIPLIRQTFWGKFSQDVCRKEKRASRGFLSTVTIITHLDVYTVYKKYFQIRGFSHSMATWSSLSGRRPIEPTVTGLPLLPPPLSMFTRRCPTNRCSFSAGMPC